MAEGDLHAGELHALVADRFAAEDEARMAWLNEQIHRDRCRICHRKLTENRLATTPGVCYLKACQRAAAKTKEEEDHR
jgi:hypothetical protein